MLLIPHTKASLLKILVMKQASRIPQLNILYNLLKREKEAAKITFSQPLYFNSFLFVSDKFYIIDT